MDTKTTIIYVVVIIVCLIIIAILTKVAKGGYNKPKQTTAENVENVVKPKKEKKVRQKKQKKVVEEKVEEKSNYETTDRYYETPISPMIMHRERYINELKEKLEAERKQQEIDELLEFERKHRFNVDNKPKEFESKAGYIETLAYFQKSDEEKEAEIQKKKQDLMSDIAGNEINIGNLSKELESLPPELKAVVLSDLMKKKY